MGSVEGLHRLKPVALRHLRCGVHGHLYDVDDWVGSVRVFLRVFRMGGNVPPARGGEMGGNFDRWGGNSM